MASVAIFLRSDDPLVVSPRHSCSKTLALQAVLLNAVRWVSDAAIQLLTYESWKEVKLRIKKVLSTKYAHINPPDYHVISLASYPPTGQESDARERQKRLWLNAERF